MEDERTPHKIAESEEDESRENTRERSDLSLTPMLK